MKTVGVLALQGSFGAHQKSVDRIDLGVETKQVRQPDDLGGCDCLIIPGGESTVMVKLAREFSLWDRISDFARSGGPVWGTCAGMILLSADIVNPSAKGLGLIDIGVVRNAYGRQVDSFEADIDIEVIEDPDRPFRGVFIRAPGVIRVGDEVEPIAYDPHKPDRPVALRQGNIFVTAFHPELTDDGRLHRFFLSFS